LRSLNKDQKDSPQDTDDSSSSSDESEPFTRESLLQAHKGFDKVPRSSVSAEAMGVFSKKKEFKKIVIPKSEVIKEKIKSRLKECFMFNNLDEEELGIVIDAMKEVKYKNETIIQQGDSGNTLYVLDSGKCHWFKLLEGEKRPSKLRDYIPGEAFGELALLYNAPRAASIKAIGEWTLFALDRGTFTHIVKDASQKNREAYEEFFKSVDFFTQMDFYERVLLCDAVKKVKYIKGDRVIKEGDPGDSFYFLLSGTAIAKKLIDGKVKNVMSYNPGDYFGERALLTQEPRAATIQATSDTLVLAKLESRSFKRLLWDNEKVKLHLLKVINNL